MWHKRHDANIHAHLTLFHRLPLQASCTDTHILSGVLYSGDTPTHKAISWGDVQRLQWGSFSRTHWLKEQSDISVNPHFYCLSQSHMRGYQFWLCASSTEKMEDPVLYSRIIEFTKILQRDSRVDDKQYTLWCRCIESVIHLSVINFELT